MAVFAYTASISRPSPFLNNSLYFPPIQIPFFASLAPLPNRRNSKSIHTVLPSSRAPLDLPITSSRQVPNCHFLLIFPFSGPLFACLENVGK